MKEEAWHIVEMVLDNEIEEGNLPEKSSDIEPE